MIHPAHFAWCILPVSSVSRVTVYSLAVLLSQFWTSLSISGSNCCFLSCILISQVRGKVTWYSHLLKVFPQFVVIHTVKGFFICDYMDLKVLKATANSKEIQQTMVMALSVHFGSLSPKDCRVRDKAWSRALTEWKYRRGTDGWSWAGISIRRWLAKERGTQTRELPFYFVMFVLGSVLSPWKEPRLIAVKDTLQCASLGSEGDSIFHILIPIPRWWNWNLEGLN